MSQPQQPIQHQDSMSSNENISEEKKKKHKSRRPPNTAFRQQRLRAWQPILTPKTVLPLFFLIGVVFAPVGGLLLWANSQVQEISINYTNCSRAAGEDFGDIPNGRVSSSFKGTTSTQHVQWKRQGGQTVVYQPQNVSVPDTSKCYLQFNIPNDLHPPVLLYYRLTNFYQNHRRYVKSFDSAQLSGTARSYQDIKSSDCDKIKSDNSSKPYYPCGLIANSIFNDTFQSPSLLNPQGGENGSTTFPMTTKGIAWSSDSKLYGKTKYNGSDISPPPNWIKRFPSYDDYVPDISTDESLWVWMRTAGLPDFSKLALRNDNQTMSKGTYEIEIWDEFDTTLYSGTKSILITTRTVMGGKNPFLGIAYIIVGGLCILLGALFTVTHLFKPRKLGDHTYLTWDKEPSTARTTGRAPRPEENTS